jgi:ABC-type amino acid transport substrate-binding protein
VFRAQPNSWAVAKGNEELLNVLDAWLLQLRLNNVIDDLYDYWIEGNIKQAQPTRWSVIRDVLQWTD